jgi:hypothetical protein
LPAVRDLQPVKVATTSVAVTSVRRILIFILLFAEFQSWLPG